MSMIIHNLIQGTPAWHAYRREHFNASDAPAMLGCSEYKTRDELLHEMATGLIPEVDEHTQRRFDDGHRFEALARPYAESLLGEDLYPVTGSRGRLSASFDGLTMDGKIAFEHKTLNAALRNVMTGDAWGFDTLPLQYRIQMEQQLMVSGAEQCFFMASQWNGDTLVEEHHCVYWSDPALRQQIVAGWGQFEKDLAAYIPPKAAAPEAVGRSPETLPALHIEVSGMVTASNLDAYRAHAMAVFGEIKRDLQTDQDFADAEKIVKWCGDVETRLEAAKDHALSQTASIDQLFKAIDDIKAEARRTRLDLDKLVAKRKDEIRTAMVTAAIQAYREHALDINAEIQPANLTCPQPDFAGAIKGRRSLDSIQDALNTALANGKIAANEQAKAIRANLATYNQVTEGYRALFADLDRLVHKPADDFALVVRTRIEQHNAQVAAKDEAAREQIRAEEQAKAEAAARAALEEAAHRTTPAPQTPQLTTLETVAKVLDIEPLNSVVAVPAMPPTLKLGVIAERLGFTLTADFLQSLGFKPAATDKAARLYHESDFAAICQALCAHIQREAKHHAATK